MKETVGCLGGGSVGGWRKVRREELGTMEKAYLCGSERFGGGGYIIRYKVRVEEDDDSGRWE